MKKIYGKPDILFESFQMGTSIGACAIVTGPMLDECGMNWRGSKTVFAEKAGVILSSACDIDVNIDVDTESFNGICYHVPIESNSLFVS